MRVNVYASRSTSQVRALRALMGEPKRIDIAEFRKVGFLQEANRLFFHPLGLALEVAVEKDGSEHLGGVWDYRDDPERIMYGEITDEMRAAAVRVAKEHARHIEARRARFGNVRDGEVQPLGEDEK